MQVAGYTEFDSLIWQPIANILQHYRPEGNRGSELREARAEDSQLRSSFDPTHTYTYFSLTARQQLTILHLGIQFTDIGTHRDSLNYKQQVIPLINYYYINYAFVFLL